MPFNSKTASQAGKKSKRGQSKATKIVKDKILAYLNEEGIEDAIREIKELEGYNKVKAILSIAEYAMPKQKAVDMTTTIQDEREELTPQEIEQRLKEMQEDLKQFDDD